MRLYSLLGLGLLMAGFCQAQATFPAAWEGYWEGALEIVGPKGVQHRVPMQLWIEKADTAGQWVWNTTYGPLDTPVVEKDYLLIEENPDLGQYRIDEQNSIVMPAFLFGENMLVCWFEVEESLIQSVYEMQPDGTLRFQIYAGNSRNLYTSGGDTLEGGEVIPEVSTYPVSVVQQALLRRK